MVNLEAVTKFQKEHKQSDIMGVIRTMYPDLEITLNKNKGKRK